MTELLKRTSESLYCDLTADELRDKGEAMAALLGEIARDEDAAAEAAKAAKLELTAKRIALAVMAEAVRQRRELREVEVEHRAFGERVEYIRTDTGESYRSRPLTDEERQRLLPSIAPVASERTA